MKNAPKIVCVMTGDLVGSQHMDRAQTDRAFEALGRVAVGLARHQDAAVPLSRHRGDGWQAALCRPQLFLRAVLAFRAALRSENARFDSYVGLAEGKVTALPGPDLNAETAPVFVRSGAELDRLKALDRSRQRFGHADGAGPAAALALADHISAGWTRAQATAILPMLLDTNPPTYTALAATLNKSRQAVTKALDAAGHEALGLAMTCIEQGTPPR